MDIKSKSGCHYFFGCSPLNFWSNLDYKSVVEGIAHVSSLGFGSLFLLVPWAEFVDDTDGEVSVQDYCAERYRWIASECQKAQISLHVRVAYLWEAAAAGSTSFDRYTSFFSDSIHSRSLSLLCRFLRAVEHEVGGDIQYFFSWEEPYWPIFSHWRSRPLEERVRLAEESGYRKFLELQGAVTSGLAAIPIRSHAEGMNFCQFYDSIILSNFIRVLKSELGEVGMEYRVDSDLIRHTGGHDEYYHWPLCHPGVTQKYVYYHPQLFGDFTGRLTAEQGNERLKWLLHTAAPRLNVGERPVIVDQFNFVDNTEELWMTIDDEQLNKFLSLAAAEVRDRRAAIVLWSIMDWPRDVIFNGSFKLNLKGWKYSGEKTILGQPQAEGVVLTAGISIEQNPQLSFPMEQGFFIEIRYELVSNEAVINISSLDENAEYQCSDKDKGVIIVKMAKYGGGLIVNGVSGTVIVNRIMMYDRYYSQGGDLSNGRRTKSFQYFLNNFNDGEA